MSFSFPGTSTSALRGAELRRSVQRRGEAAGGVPPPLYMPFGKGITSPALRMSGLNLQTEQGYCVFLDPSHCLGHNNQGAMKERTDGLETERP